MSGLEEPDIKVAEMWGFSGGPKRLGRLDERNDGHEVREDEGIVHVHHEELTQVHVLFICVPDVPRAVVVSVLQCTQIRGGT